MALGINSYNDVFRNFAEFAQKSLEAGDEKAIAAVDEQQSLDGRKILTVTNSFSDHLKNWNTWTRRWDAKSANDFARQLFRDSVASMFGGEAKIPESVKKAMILGDYNSGKPLTARRILAVKVAIDAVGTQAAAPLKSENPVKMNARLAAKYVDDAAKALDVELSRPQKKLAESLIVKYGTDMPETNARMFAKFVVRLPLTDDSADLPRRSRARTSRCSSARPRSRSVS